MASTKLKGGIIMPQTVFITMPDGSTVEKTAKYGSKELDQMSAEQLIPILSEMMQFAHYCCSQILDPMSRLKDECKELTIEKFDTRDEARKYGIALAVTTGIWLILKIARLHLLSFFFGFLPLGCALLFGVYLIRAIAASRKYAKRYPLAEAELQQYTAKRDTEIYGPYLDDLVTCQAVLPKYYLSETALGFMISALQNHRATNLMQAVNLYESAKLMQNQNQLLAAQLAAQESAARSAAAAAAAAERAASSASMTATNTLHNRKS